jgi:hypothetical protein
MRTCRGQQPRSCRCPGSPGHSCRSPLPTDPPQARTNPLAATVVRPRGSHRGDRWSASESFGVGKEFGWSEPGGSDDFDAEQGAGLVEVQDDLSLARSSDDEVLDGFTGGDVP